MKDMLVIRESAGAGSLRVNEVLAKRLFANCAEEVKSAQSWAIVPIAFNSLWEEFAKNVNRFEAILEGGAKISKTDGADEYCFKWYSSDAHDARDAIANAGLLGKIVFITTKREKELLALAGID